MMFLFFSLTDAVIVVVLLTADHKSLLMSKVTIAVDVITQHLRRLLAFTTEIPYMLVIITK